MSKGTSMKTVLVLCTGNSARSIMAEAYINHIGAGAWEAVSAGSNPTGRVNPFALKALEASGIPVPSDAQSKSWAVFAAPGSRPIDLVLTVCDNAAGEPCPNFPGAGLKVHLPFPDPAAVNGSDEQRLQAFQDIFAMMRPKLDALVAGMRADAAGGEARMGGF